MAAGFDPEDYWEDPVSVWPENVEVFSIFVRLQTQWNWVAGLGGGGRTGLKYEALYPLLDRMCRGNHAEWDALLADVQAMEQAVLMIEGH